MRDFIGYLYSFAKLTLVLVVINYIGHFSTSYGWCLIPAIVLMSLMAADACAQLIINAAKNLDE